MQNKQQVVIGLTGNIGAGKNAVAEILSQYGAKIIDADETSHRIMLKGNAAYDEVLDVFGGDIIDKTGEIDRKRLGEIVFNDVDKLNKLVEILRKYILRDIIAALEAFKKAADSIIVINAPLLIEYGLDKHADTVWFVFADEEKRIERVMARDKVSRGFVVSRIKNQTHPFTLMQSADEIIENNDSLEKLREKIDALIKNTHTAL